MRKSGQIVSKDYAALLAEVKERVRAAQYAALRAVNKELVSLYWDIGRLIVSRQADAAHGAAIAEKLAADLRMEFPGVGGYSRRNVFYMREFYLAYRKLPKVQPLVAQIGVLLQEALMFDTATGIERPTSRSRGNCQTAGGHGMRRKAGIQENFEELGI